MLLELMTESSNVHVSGDKGAEGAWRWWQRIGCPRHVCAPMVWNSELCFRLLVRKHDVHLTYTPMIVASRFLALKTNAERLALIEPHADDRPLVVQFAADNPETLVAAGLLAQDYCDAIDLNLGCPQPQAVRDHYGSILMEEPELVEAMVKAASSHLKVPITVKIRIFADLDRSIKFAKMLEFAGASAVTVHGRTSSCTHHEGECSWDAIRAIKEALNIPVIANGGPIRSREDADLCLAHTGADAVMSAIGLLLDPRLFTRTCAEKYDTIETALEYCDAARQVASTPAISMRQHLMAILRYLFSPSSSRPFQWHRVI